MTLAAGVPPLTPPEEQLVQQMNAREGRFDGWDKQRFLSDLTDHLQVAVEVELATIPIYLATYYTIDRTPNKDHQKSDEAFPKSPLSRFADEAGALIMSVAIEEMLHLSLSSNVLFSLGKDPLIYQHAPKQYPAYLAGHRHNGLINPDGNNVRNLPIPLAKFSFEQLSHFLAIEYPAAPDAPPEPGNWDTIGQIYSYVRCLISSQWIEDSDFRVRNSGNQISATEYSPNCIDTVYPTEPFDYVCPLPAPEEGSTAKVAAYASDEDSHEGDAQLLTIRSCRDAMLAIATIDHQGEGFDFTKHDDPADCELSHYYKFLTLQSKLCGYDEAYLELTGSDYSNVAELPPPPAIPDTQYDPCQLQQFVVPAPANPTRDQFTEGRQDLVQVADALFQYMLIMTETTFRIPPDKQKIYFNRAMHQSMIWVLDKMLQGLRSVKTADGKHTLCATFADVDLGPRHEAFGNLTTLVTDFLNTYGASSPNPAPWFTATDLNYYLGKILELPDVSVFWVGPQPPSRLPTYLHQPDVSARPTVDSQAPKQPIIVSDGDYQGTPQWPLNPPTDEQLPEGTVRHACMGLNSCKNQGRTVANECAGQGFCSTALRYNPSYPSSPGIKDHTCHVLNDCRNQGGCGLYGTEEELKEPGHNDCQSLGSCATPINAERFITDGDLRGQSVWCQARKVFTEKVWPQLVEQDPTLPDEPPMTPGSTSQPDLFQYGPTIGWIENKNNGQGMTACGASGMSGAGSCA